MLDVFKRRKAELLQRIAAQGEAASIDLDAATGQALAARASLYRDRGPLDCGLYEAERRLKARAAAAREMIDARPRSGAPEAVKRRTRKAARLEAEILSEINFAIETLDRAIAITRSINE